MKGGGRIKFKRQRKRGSWTVGSKHRRHAGSWWLWLTLELAVKRRRAKRAAVLAKIEELRKRKGRP